MPSAVQNEHDTYRVIVLGRGGTEVLLIRDDQRLMLPAVEIPRWQRVAENLTAAFKANWGVEVVCLFEPPTEPLPAAGVTRYEATEYLRTSGNPKIPMQWVPVSALRPDSLAEGRDYAAVQQVVGVSNAGSKRARVGPFGRLGWFGELQDWIKSVVEPMGFHLTGMFRQLNASPSFSLVRFETDGAALWFKAVGEPNQRESGITSTLARLFPRYLPCIVATRPDWNGWITREAEGKLLCDTPGPRPWHKVAFDLAELQVHSSGSVQAILANGAHDLRLGSLSKQIPPFVDAAQQIMERQAKTPPPVLGRKELLLLADRICNAFDLIKRFAVPDALGHLDFNPGNVIVSAKGSIFLDWAEAYVGNPFLTLQYLLEHFRRRDGNDSISSELELVNSYVVPWLRSLSREAIDAALAVSPLIAVFSYATATGMLTDEKRLENAHFAGYMRSLVRRMDREACAWSERSRKCSTPLIVSQP